MKIFSVIKNYSHLVVIGFICIVLWGLNVRNTQLLTTVQRLERLVDSKDAQINELRENNSNLTTDLRTIAVQVEQTNNILLQVQEDKANSEKITRELLGDIKRTLKNDPHAAASVPDDAVEQLHNAEQAASDISTKCNAAHSNTRKSDG
ncbi:Rz lytic protein [Enterobacteriaceae bacterium LUAb1]